MDIVVRGIGDNLGPAKVVLLRDPRAGLEAVVVVDNVACGPAIGGVRMAADVTVDEVFRLARAMTFTQETLERVRAGGLLPRQAAIQMARVRIEEAMRYRGY